MVPQPSTCTPNDPENVPKVLQNHPQTASRKGFPTPSEPYQKGKRATYKFHQPSFPKQPIRHTPPLQLTAQQTEKARSNGQKHKKHGFIEETQKQEAQERPMGTASCLKKTCMRRNRQANTPYDSADFQPPFRPTGIISHATLPPHGTFSAKWCTALRQPSQRSA